MKKVLLVLISLVVLLGGCKEKSDNQIPRSNWAIHEIDSCEYVFVGLRMAHKGNCKYCEERQDKKRRELLVELKNLMSELRETDLLFMQEEK